MYVEKTDKEIIEQLEFCDNYEAVYLIKNLKKQVANLKREITRKYNLNIIKMSKIELIKQKAKELNILIETEANKREPVFDNNRYRNDCEWVNSEEGRNWEMRCSKLEDALALNKEALRFIESIEPSNVLDRLSAEIEA